MPNKAGFSAGVRGGRKSSPRPRPFGPGIVPKSAALPFWELQWREGTFAKWSAPVLWSGWGVLSSTCLSTLEPGVLISVLSPVPSTLATTSVLLFQECAYSCHSAFAPAVCALIWNILPQTSPQLTPFISPLDGHLPHEATGPTPPMPAWLCFPLSLVPPSVPQGPHVPPSFRPDCQLHQGRCWLVASGGHSA